MGFLRDTKKVWDEASVEAATVPKGELVELAARPLPQLAADLFAACFAPGTKGWWNGASQSDATADFFESQGLERSQTQATLANALVAEAFQLLDQRGLLCLYLADGGSSVHVHWYVTRAGRAAAEAGPIRPLLEG